MPYAKAKSSSELPESIQDCVSKAHAHNQTIVLVTGVFDLLHEEHKQFLIKAKAEGDVLIIGIESDVRVRQLKGEGRPRMNEAERVAALESLLIADQVFVLPEEFSAPNDYVSLITRLKPHILAVSSSTPYIDRKQAVMDMVGGIVKIVHEHNPAVSTTQILQQQK